MIPTRTKITKTPDSKASDIKFEGLAGGWEVFVSKTQPRWNRKFIKNLFTSKTAFSDAKSNTQLWYLYSIIFLKKEKIYTKLKYSRTPQYDIVSGGLAAIFAGFLGFLICEKFGFELLDSADFYFVFMYAVFVFFAMRLYLSIANHELSNWLPFSVKWFFNFYFIIFKLTCNYMQRSYRVIFLKL